MEKSNRHETFKQNLANHLKELLKLPDIVEIISSHDVKLGCLKYNFFQNKKQICQAYIATEYLSEISNGGVSAPELIFNELDSVISEPYGLSNVDHRSAQAQKERFISVNRLGDTGIVAKLRYGTLKPNHFNTFKEPRGLGKGDFILIRKAIMASRRDGVLRRLIEFCPTYAYIDFYEKFEIRTDTILMRDLTKFPRLATINDENLEQNLNSVIRSTLIESGYKLNKNSIVRYLQKILTDIQINTTDLHDSNIFLVDGKFEIIDI